MPNDKEHFVGMDVSKDTLDVAVLGKRSIEQFANTKKGIAKLVRGMHPLNPKRIVVEATGCYEQAVVLALFEAGLPVALVSPQRVRQYAKGLLAKTDKLDAHILADFGKHIQPRCLWQKVRSARGSLVWSSGENSSMTCSRLGNTACAPVP